MITDRDRFREIERLYRLALEQEPNQRADFLRRSCGNDEYLLNAVESQLARDEQLLQTSALEITNQTLAKSQSRSMVGRQLGPYDILNLLGIGGMGEVYRARDTRLDRFVAIKVLPPSLAQDPERRKRFEREAQAVSSLNHPHICTLYDVGNQDGIDFLVMEYLEGETLAQRLKKGPLHLDQGMRYAIDMADALAEAHRHGIIHRDFKPGNIMLTKSGVKLLDFGLAKVLAAKATGDITTLRTETVSLNTEGMILGTLAYMAPEQFEGKEADARSDTFALGVVMYEMATGRRPFEGNTQAKLMSAIMTADPPPISTLHNLAPPALDHVVRTCLAKDPDNRWQTPRDVYLEVKWIAEVGTQVGISVAASSESVRKLHRERMFLVWAIVAALGITVALWVRWPEPPTAPPVKFAFIPHGDFTTPAMSPDARRIAYVLRNPNKQPEEIAGSPGIAAVGSLWIQDLDRERPRQVEGTESAELPFWSPDSEFVGFAARNYLWKTGAATGSPSPICQITDEFLGGSWSLDGRSIIYSIHRQGIYEVPAAGGASKMLVEVDRSMSGDHFDAPQLLPTQDGRRSLIYADRQKNGAVHDIFLLSLDSGKRSLLVKAAYRQFYSPTGHVLYTSMADSLQLLMALPFSVAKMHATGDPFPVAQSGFSASVARNGTLVYKGTGEYPPTQLAWHNHSNKITIVGPVDLLFVKNISLSPDGRSLALDAFRNRDREIWILDIMRGSKTRLPFSSPWYADPVWSPTAKEITFRSNHRGYWEIYTMRVDGSGEAKLVATGPSTKRPNDWSPDEKFLVYEMEDPKTQMDLWYLRAKEDGSGYESVPFLRTSAVEEGAKFSPDGRFLAYVSDQSGRSEVYIKRFPDDGSPARQISANGGKQPTWAKNGKDLFYLEGNTLIAVSTASTPDFPVAVTKNLFKNRFLTNVEGAGYVVSPDGQQFLIAEPSGPIPPPVIRVVQNWFTEFNHHTPGQ